MVILGDLGEQRQQTHTSIAPDCSIAETKWFFTPDLEYTSLHYHVCLQKIETTFLDELVLMN